MTNAKDIEKFLIRARTNTYAGSGGKVEALLEDSKQLEYKEDLWMYRDVYFTGKHTFVGLETIYNNNKAVFSMSYYGNWGTMTEQEIDNILRNALIENHETRLYKNIEWKKDGFTYNCSPDLNEGIEEIGGTETITREGEQVYVLYYAGSILI